MFHVNKTNNGFSAANFRIRLTNLMTNFKASMSLLATLTLMSVRISVADSSN